MSLESLGLILDPLTRVLRPLPMVLGRFTHEPGGTLRDTFASYDGIRPSCFRNVAISQ